MEKRNVRAIDLQNIINRGYSLEEIRELKEKAIEANLKSMVLFFEEMEKNKNLP